MTAAIAGNWRRRAPAVEISDEVFYRDRHFRDRRNQILFRV
jgi:hypothetical protein